MQPRPVFLLDGRLRLRIYPAEHAEIIVVVIDIRAGPAADRNRLICRAEYQRRRIAFGNIHVNFHRECVGTAFQPVVHRKMVAVGFVDGDRAILVDGYTLADE